MERDTTSCMLVIKHHKHHLISLESARPPVPLVQQGSLIYDRLPMETKDLILFPLEQWQDLLASVGTGWVPNRAGLDQQLMAQPTVRTSLSCSCSSPGDYNSEGDSLFPGLSGALRREIKWHWAGSVSLQCTGITMLLGVLG